MQLRAFAVGLAGAAVAALVAIATLQSWSPEAWAALAAWITAAVAVAAGVVALGQLGEARRARLEQARLRKEQAQPYVVAYMEFSEASTYLVDLVVRNFGATAAHDVRLDIEPKPRRSIDQKRQERADAEQPADMADQPKQEPPSDADRTKRKQQDAQQPDPYVWLPGRLPVLVPGQEWRTLWDTGRRTESALPDRHDARITYRDSQGESYTVEAVLDWRFVKDREMVTIYGAHDAARALREISKAMTKWTEAPIGGLRVFVRDGDAKDQRQQEYLEARRPAREACERAAGKPQPPSE